MRYQRIHVLGGPGSGKTYVAAKIAAALGIQAYDLDDLFWDSSAPTYSVKADQEKREQTRHHPTWWLSRMCRAQRERASGSSWPGQTTRTSSVCEG